MLGQPSSMLIPQVVGFQLTGRLPEGATATDLVLTVTQMLRQHGVVGKFVEFYGDGLQHLPLADRATIGNMSPEYGATCAIFPIDAESLNYLRLSGRSEAQIALVEAYAKAQGLWHDAGQPARAVQLDAGAGHGDGAAVAGRPQASAGPGAAAGDAGQQPRRDCRADRRARQAQRRGGRFHRRGRRRRGRQRAAWQGPGRHLHRRYPRADQGRRGGHRRHHLLHQHLQPGGDGRGRPAGPQCGRARA